MTSFGTAELRRAFLSKVGEKLELYGFDRRPAGQDFTRRMQFGLWIVHVSFVTGQSAFDLSVDVAIRVDVVEDLVNADNRMLSVKEKRRTATVGAELGNIADHRFMNWHVQGLGDIEPVVQAIIHEFENWGLPYLERLSHLDVMLENLSRDDGSAWLYSPIPPARYKRAVALAIVLQRFDHARELARIGEERLKQQGDPALPGFRESIARMLQSTERRS